MNNHRSGSILMRRTNCIGASMVVGAALAVISPSGAVLAQPTGAEHVLRIVTDPTPEDIEGARQFVAVMYHGETDADTEDWLFERLMDRYRRAFDQFDNVDDPAVTATVAEVLKSVQPRLHRIVAPRVPALRVAAMSTFAMQWRGDDMRTLLAFARTSAGKRYFEAFPLFEQSYYLNPVLVPLIHDNMELANAVIGELSERLGARFTDHPEYARAFMAAASEI